MVSIYDLGKSGGAIDHCFTSHLIDVLYIHKYKSYKIISGAQSTFKPKRENRSKKNKWELCSKRTISGPKMALNYAITVNAYATK